MCLALSEFRLVAIQPVEPSQTGCRIRERGRPAVSMVVTVHQTVRLTRRGNSASIAEKGATSMGRPPALYAARWARLYQGCRQEWLASDGGARAAGGCFTNRDP